MKPHWKRVVLTASAISAMIAGSFIFSYASGGEAQEKQDFWDAVKKETEKNPNNDHLSLFQAMQKVMNEKRLAEKNKLTDPNDPRNDPRLKDYFGSIHETAPVPAVINYGGLTMMVQANELILSSLDKSEISGRQSSNLTFLLTYPQMIGKTPENFDDFYRGIPGEQKNIWLHINTEPACFSEDQMQVVPSDFNKLDKQNTELLIKNRDCPARRNFDITYSVYGNKSYHVLGTYKETKIHGWKPPSVYPDLSKYYETDKLILDGYRIQGLTEKNTDLIDERVYTYIPPDAKKGEYEFIVCGANPDVMPQKFPQMRFDDDLYAGCMHYMVIKNRMIVRIEYPEKYFKQHWKTIRDNVVKHFHSRITAVDDYVPLFYTKHKDGYQPVPQKQIDDFIKQNPKLKTH